MRWLSSPLACRTVPKHTYGYIDTQGKLVVPGPFTWATDFRGGLAQVEEDGRYGYIDRDGKYVWRQNPPAPHR